MDMMTTWNQVLQWPAAEQWEFAQKIWAGDMLDMETGEPRAEMEA